MTYFIYFEKDRNLFESATAPVFYLLVLHCKLHNRYVPSSSSFDAPKCLFWHWRYLSEKMGVYLILLRYRNAIIVSFQWRRDWFFCGFVMQLITLQVTLPLMCHFCLEHILSWIRQLWLIFWWIHAIYHIIRQNIIFIWERNAFF